MALPSADDTGYVHDRMARPSTMTVHAPQAAMPQPNFVPVMPSVSRSTHNSGVSPSTSTVLSLPLTVNVTGPEVVTGSTRMKAGTATKLILNTITTGAMIRLGKTFGNLMVDLRATNDKLVDRSQRIVMEIAGLDRAAAKKVLDAAGGVVKTAIVMSILDIDRAEAEKRLS